MENTSSSTDLANKVVWIIDDSILVNSDIEGDDSVAGKRPIDRGTLKSLLSVEGWTDQSVHALCDELLSKANNVMAFRQPDAAIKYLKEGARLPDVIVYDLVYASSSKDKSSLADLEYILSHCLCTVQVYTQEPAEEYNVELGLLREKYLSRFAEPKPKTITAEALADLIGKHLQTSFSAHLANAVRLSSAKAIEEVLVKIDNLPLDYAVKLLTGNEKPEDLELLDLLGIKVGEALESNKELNDAVGQYFTGKGLDPEAVNKVVGEIVALLVSHTREYVSEGGLLKIIRDASEISVAKENALPQEKSDQVIRDFFAFRLFSHPKDDLVRTGDIMASTAEHVAPSDFPTLYLVLTPPCDLEKFWKKTRGVLTLAKMHPLTNEGTQEVKNYGNPNFEMGESITARHPLVIPWVPLGSSSNMDYVLFAYEISFMYFEDAALAKAGKTNKQVDRPLFYENLQGKVARKCRLSEPFLTGILSQIQDILFRSGIPNYPHEEKNRLQNMFKPVA